MREYRKKGFTLTELMVVLAVIAILLAVAIPSALNYFRLAEFRKNESNAKTVYLAAESALTWYRASGEWEEFRKDVVHLGMPNQDFAESDDRHGRIYAVTLNKSAGEPSDSQKLVEELLANLSYDGDFLNASIVIEIDVETGQVYSAFYNTRCSALKYKLTEADQDKNGILEIGEDRRGYDDRRKVLLGYYSVEDVTNVVDIKPVPLKVTSINLVNGETLSLNWSGNSRHDNLDVAYTVTFYQESGGAFSEDVKLFSLEVDLFDLNGHGWISGEAAALELFYSGAGMADIPDGNWRFPLSYEDGKFSLVLDGMMSANLNALLEARNTDSADDSKTQKFFNTSITRLGEQISALRALTEPQDIYAVVEAQCTYRGMGGDIREYSPSSPVKSNTENTLFADVEEKSPEDGSTVREAKITKFRHLSNIRYFDKKEAAEFVLAGSLDWTASGGGVYDVTEKTVNAQTGEKGFVLSWEGIVQGERILDFPSVPLFSKEHVLVKEGASVKISNLHLGAGSVADDVWVEKLYPGTGEAENHYSHYLGLFCESEGSVQGIVFQNPRVVLKGTGTDAEGSPNPVQGYAHLYGVGLLAGRNAGNVDSVSVKAVRKSGSTREVPNTLEVYLADRESGEAYKKPAGIGGLIGVLGDRDGNGDLTRLSGIVSIKDVTAEGVVTGSLPAPDEVLPEEGSTYALAREADTADGEDLDPANKAALKYRYGIGGIIGYAWIGDGVEITGCENSADVTGNLFAGGVCGNLTGNFVKTGSGAGTVSMEDCGNEGLVLCSVKTADGAGSNLGNMAGSLEGRYFGGILGYSSNAWIKNSVSASGRRADNPYTLKDRDKLQGWYVGGILGYGSDSLLTGCGTKKGGYILGSDYVGGIAGGLSSNIAEAIKGDDTGVAVTSNEGYVIGNRCVGGIVGKNDGTSETVIQNCINNGAAVGYDRYIGGIVGYNGKNGKLEDCASYISDYNHSVFDRIVKEWQAMGDCSGGLVGYNNGAIHFSGDNPEITVKSVAGIAVGGSYVGGVIGFNDVNGTLDVNYTLIGGQIYAFGDAAGGCIGLNASHLVLQQKLAVRPQSVRGRNFVGGVIGANVVDLPGDVTADRLETDNVLGSIEGEAFVGGVIGYHRTYTQEQLKTAAAQAGMAAGDDGLLSVLDYLLFGENPDTDAEQYQKILPELDEDNIPKKILESDNSYVFRFTKAAKDGEDNVWKEDSNNMAIRAYIYAGGIVGYCEQSSRLHLVDCKNAGGISRPAASADGMPLSRASDGVSLVGYLEKEGRISLADTEKEELRDLKVYMVGGMISANLQNQVIDHCVNKGSMNGFVGLGGIVGFNGGGVFSCALEDNFGSSELDYIGGIAGLNVGSGSKDKETKQEYINYKGKRIEYWPGTVADCSTAGGKSVLGRSYVGGIAGYNMRGGILEDNLSRANVTAAGDAERGIAYVGGIAGCNNGWLAIAEDTGTDTRTIRADQGAGVGGIAGVNQKDGCIYVRSSGTGAGQEEETVVVGEHVTVTGWRKVGGIVGINRGELSARDMDPDAAEPGNGDLLPWLTCQAREIRAVSGYAGGIAGEASGSISRVKNKSLRVTADQGPAGGIVAVNGENITLSQCWNYGNVNADKGYAGGIAAENYGVIADCMVGFDSVPGNGEELTISSRGMDAIGAVCAVNHGKGDKKEDGTDAAGNALLYASVPLEGVILSGNAEKVGGITGVNRGILGKEGNANKTVLTHVPEIRSTFSGRLTVGAAAGENMGVSESAAAEGEKEGTIRNVTVEGAEFKDFHNIAFLGGIVGRNRAWGEVMLCSFNGSILQNAGASAAGDCYGGIAGENSGELKDCQIRSSMFDIKGGVYTATSISSATEKEALSSHVGGICGKNERYIDEESGEVICGRIIGCVIEGGTGEAGSLPDGKTQITVSNGMAGGIAGYNKGLIELSGDKNTVVSALLEDGIGDNGRISTAEKVETAAAMLGKAGNKAEDTSYVAWGTGELEDLSYAGGAKNKVNAGRSMSVILANNGNVGGITAYNAPSGSVNYCATGSWYLNNKSNAIGVGTGGIIGMNESEQDLSYLLNKAFVGRQIANGDTNRFAGGIIGNQNNTTKSEWKIENCVNYGTVYCLRTHYSGGILGQWTGTGGTLEHCYNYGNLQTTYEKGWLGAAGGIVAQLYHAYEGNHYNIVSCGNYGNLYGRNGGEREGGVIKNCANDSAGILGNITAYEAKSADSAQHFTVQVLDCVNGSGVEIYSTSMASGIVGFVSCDNAKDAAQIRTATGNIEIRIERCRNFAAILEGGSNAFSAGIFGDRYGGDEKNRRTVIKDCYSVNPQAGKTNTGYHYHAMGYPVISYRNGLSNASAIDAERNYFLEDGRAEANSFVNSGTIKDDGGNQSYFSITSGTLSGDLGRAGAGRAYKVQGTSGKYYVVAVTQGATLSSNCRIDADGRILNGNKEIGQVLFDTGMNDFSGLYSGGSANSVMVRDSDFDTYVRLSYHRIEGAAEGRMPRPTVALEHVPGSNRVTVKVTPGSGSDPFKYVAMLYSGDRVIKENYTFYSENDTFEISPEDAGGSEGWKIVLRAYSMYDEVQPSEPADSVQDPITETVLPNPDIRIELEESAAGDGFTYLYQLQNMADYADFDNQYDIVVKFMDTAGTGGAEITLGNSGEFRREQTESSLQQLVVRAVPKSAFENSLLPSGEVSVPVYLPGNEKGADGNQNQYHPSIPLKDSSGDKVTCELSGTNLSDMKLTVTLDASASGNVTTPPIYRVELLGTWESGGAEVKEAVLAYQNILAAANGTASATFANLNQYDYIAGVKDLQVRVWYAESGLGPVYTWHPVDADETGLPQGNANLSILTGVQEAPDGNETALVPEWNYEYSAVLAQKEGAFQNYVWTSQKDIFTWLAAPVLMAGEGEENFLKPEYPEPDKNLQYTFRWDQEPGQKKERYMVSLAGINRDTQERVSLVTDAVVTDNEYSVRAEEWNYSQVELTVTSLGDAGQKTIGLSSKGIYSVASRLPKPGQPVVTNTDVNEMIYRIEWNPVSPETGCVSYQIYMQFYKEDGTLSDPEPVGDKVSVSEIQGNRYVRSDINLEAYLTGEAASARRALVYIVAEADETKPQLGYVNSQPGITYELQIPSRIKTPKVTWGHSWTYDRIHPLSVEEFRQDGMTVSVTPDADSIPPGGSTYLLAAWVVDSDTEDVRNVIAAVNTDGKLPGQNAVPGLKAVYPADGDGIAPIQMDVDANQVYRHSLNGLSAEYAGKYIFFCTRISSGNGSFSSGWVASDLIRLPYVKLAEPAVTGDVRSKTAEMITYTNPDLPDDKTEETWRVNHIAFHWGAVEHADSYYVTITPRAKDENPVTPTELKIVEETGADGETVPGVYVKQADGSWLNMTPETEEGGRTAYGLDYSQEISGKYEAGGIPVFYSGTLYGVIETERNENGNYVYTLILPDANDLVTGKDVVITGDELRGTASVEIRADVKENDPDEGSEAYVGSETVRNGIGN